MVLSAGPLAEIAGGLFTAMGVGNFAKEPTLGNGVVAALPFVPIGGKGGQPKLLGPATKFGVKIEGQLATRGWTKELVQSRIDRPARTALTTDTRRLPGGVRMNDPATVYYSQRGGYVVRNNRTGDIVQVSKRTDPSWKAPWD
jgi:hypothetical protein